MAGSGSASARDAGAGASVLGTSKYYHYLDAECGDIPASQKAILARAPFIGGGEEEEEAEVFSTPPLSQRDLQSQGGHAGDGEDGITMCSIPFTQTQPPSPCPTSSSSPFPTSSSSASPSPSPSPPRKPTKPRICTRKVRGGAKLRTPSPDPAPAPAPKPQKPRICTRKVRGGAKLRTPSPEPAPAPAPAPTPAPAPAPTTAPAPAPTAAPSPTPALAPASTPAPAPPIPSPELDLDPLAKIVFMIPTAPLRTGDVDIFELACSRGIF